MIISQRQRWKIAAMQVGSVLLVIAFFAGFIYVSKLQHDRVNAKKAALDNVLRGMSDEALVKVAGEPDDISTWDRHGPNEHETWTYRLDREGEPTYSIKIVDGEVTRVDRF
jgi:hypothetical protein